MEKQRTNNGPLKELADKHSIYTLAGSALERCPDSSVAGMEIATTRFQNRLGRRPQRPTHNGPKALVFTGGRTNA